jgi:hypothetical protein
MYLDEPPLLKHGRRAASPNSALQRAARRIKCSAAGGRAESAHERWRARVLRRRRAVAELGSWASLVHEPHHR